MNRTGNSKHHTTMNKNMDALRGYPVRNQQHVVQPTNEWPKEVNGILICRARHSSWYIMTMAAIHTLHVLTGFVPNSSYNQACSKSRRTPMLSLCMPMATISLCPCLPRVSSYPGRSRDLNLLRSLANRSWL